MKFTVVEKRSVEPVQKWVIFHSTWEFRLWLVGLANDASFLSYLSLVAQSRAHRLFAIEVE